MPCLTETKDINELFQLKAAKQKVDARSILSRQNSTDVVSSAKRKRANSHATAPQQHILPKQESVLAPAHNKTLNILPGTSLLPKLTQRPPAPEFVTSQSSAVNVLQTLLANSTNAGVSLTSAATRGGVAQTPANSLPVQVLNPQQLLQLLAQQSAVAAPQIQAPVQQAAGSVQLTQDVATQQLQKLIQQQLIQATLQQQLTQQLQQQLAATQSRQTNNSSQQTPILPKPEPATVSLINLESFQRLASKAPTATLKPVVTPAVASTSVASRELSTATAVTLPISLNQLLQPISALSARPSAQTTNSTANLQQALATAQVLNSLGSVPLLPQTAILPIVVSLPNSVTSSAFPLPQLSRVAPKSDK